LGDQSRPFLAKHGYQIVQCQRCGFLYVHPRPSPDALTAFYQHPRYFQSDEAYGYSAYAADREEIERQASERLTFIERLMKPGRLLDLGCAAGYFLNVAKARGWQVEGIEVSQVVVQSAEHLLGQRIQPTLEAACFGSDSFDVATLWEYIEHVPDPRDDLQRVHQLLKPGGVLALSTPNAGQPRVRRYPDVWREFKPPEHLSFFTVETLTTLMGACGFEPVIIRVIAPEIRPSERVQRWIDQLRQSLGDRHTRSTPLWWIYSIARRGLLLPTWLHQKVFLSPVDYCQGIEVYGRKPLGKGVRSQESAVRSQESGVSR
jgi:SAM-dependent methyltransferase